MKTNLKMFLSILAFGLLVSSSLLAQTQAPTAWLTDDLSITLDTNTPVSATYVADVSHYASNMADQQKAELFLKQFERPYTSYKVDLQTFKMTVSLEMNAETKNWTTERWNEYLKSN